jgi:ribonucleotide reductase alpha subunit
MSNADPTADDIELPIKRTTGDTLEERLTGNAYHNILPARYLRKDADGDLTEDQADLFERVAKNIALAEAVYEAGKHDVTVTVTPDQLKPDHPRRDELAAEVFGAGTTAADWEADGEEAPEDASGETASSAETTLSQHNVNKFAYETVVPELPAAVREHVEETASEFQELMEQLSFMPNCVPPDSMVASEGGLKPLTDVEPGERVYDDEDGSARVESKFENGEKLVREIETRSGYTVRATPEHYFRVVADDGEYEWRQVKDLRPDDVLALQKNFLDDDGSAAELRPNGAADGGTVAATSDGVGRPKSAIETPGTMTPTLAEWLGLYVGDGTARESGVRVAFDKQDDDLVDYWQDLTDAVFGFEPTARERNDAECVVGQASRRSLYEFLDRNDLLKETSKTATVPEAVLESGRTCIAQFLRGLFEADGTVGERAIELYTHSEPLADQVQQLLLGLGIRSSINRKGDGYRVTVRKNVCGKRFVERVGFRSERKRVDAERFETVSDDASSVTIPNQTGRLDEWYQQSDLGHDAYRALSQFLVDPDSEYHQEIGVGIFRRYAETHPELWDSPVAEFVERDQFYEPVSDIRDVGRMTVEDMQVPRRNTYVVEGFVSHNSPTLMNAGDELQQLSACFVDSPEDDIDDIHQTAKEAAQVFQCLTADTNVSVEGEGVVSIADVEPGDRVVQRDGDGHRTRTVEETHAYHDAPVHRIETAAGVDITGTPNHELLVDDEWSRIDAVEPGDTLSLRLGWIDAADATPELTTVAGGPQWSEQRTVSNDEILELYPEGLSDYEIADRLDSSVSTVQRRRSLELGLDPNGDGGRPGGNVDFDESEFDSLYADGRSDGDIASELGVSTRTAARHRETHSLEANGEAVKTVRQPTELTPDLAELVGMWVGDGSKHRDGIRFHLNRDETLERADRLCRDLFDTGLDWRWEDGCYDAVVHSHEVKRWWLANFGDAKPDATSASVPDALWRADRETVGAFLRGLFSTDGSLQNEAYPRFWTSSEDLVDDVQQLLLGIDIPAAQWEYDVDHREYFNVGPTGERGLEEFIDTVGFVDSRSETMVETFEGIDSQEPNVGTVDGSTWQVPVETIEAAGTATVYDVTVAGDHEYVASSVVSHNSGGGMGYAFWRLRPYGDAVGSTGGIASGPITFMRTFDQMCETIAQGGARRGAQMGVMRVSHPDVIQFIHAKNKDVSLAQTLRLNDPDDFTHNSFADALEEARELIDDDGKVPKHLRNAVEGHLSNFNISVGVTDRFMDAVKHDEDYTFTNPRTGEPHVATAETKELYDMFDLGEYVEVGEVLSVPAAQLWEHIIEGAHENGEPGIIYLERVNKEHSFDTEEHPEHRILATNPCLTGDTEVVLADGTTETLEALAENGQDVRVLCRDTETDDLVVRVGRNPRRTRENADLVRVETEDGTSLTCTPDHDIWTPDGYVEAGELAPGDTVVGTTEVAIPVGGVSETVSGQLVVSSVSDAGSGPVYNVTVDDHHNYLAVTDGDTYVSVANCGEQPLEEYEACNLGHINLSTLAAADAPDWRVWQGEHADEYDTHEDAVDAFLEEAIDWAAFDYRIEMGTRFLENVVTMSDFPVEEIEDTVREMRKVGLGIMGLAQLNIQLGLRYGSDTSNEVARQLMRHINHGSKWASHELAEDRGTFGEWEKSKFASPTEYREWFEKQTGLDADEWADGFPIRNHNTTTIAPTGCVEERSLVSTDDGLRPIEDLDDTGAEFEQWGELDVGVSTDGGTKTATAVYDNGFADVRRIETEGGFTVAATPNHRFRTITADGEYVWKEADEFEPGDRVVLQRGTFDGGSRVELDSSERANYYHNTDADLELPDRMGPELAEFIGYFMGDGYVHDEVGVKLVAESDATELDEYLRDLGESVFGVTPTVEGRDTRHMLTFGGRHLSRYFDDNDWKKDPGNEGEGAASAFVPEEVLRGDEAVAKAFLRGLFEAGGTASRKVELSTVSPTLVQQVQTLLLSLDCVFVRDVLEMDQRDDHYGDRPRHTLRGANRREDQRFLKEVGFITKSTDFELTAQSSKNDTYPPAVVDALRDVDGYEDVSSPVKHRVNQSPINGSVSRKLVRDVEAETGERVRLDGRPLTDFYAAPVESVTEETAYTKDISVPSNNTYVANGFVTHNTTSMVGNTTGGCEPIYNVAYYKNVSDDVQGDEMLVEFDDYFLRVLEENDLDVEAVKQEAQEQMAANEFDGVDGLTTVPDAVGELFVTTGDLSAKDHAGVQVACQEGVDSAISKTVNAPNDSTVADAKEVFEYIYEHGGKGVTYYRDGTRSKQVLTTRAQNTEFADMDAEEVVAQIEEVFGGMDAFLEDEAVGAAIDDEMGEVLGAVDGESTEYAQKQPRPDVLHGVTQRIDTGYGKLYVNINEDPENDRPFELFANIGNSGGFTASFTEALAKTISTALRSGVDPHEIADELQGIRSPKVAWDKGEQIQSIPDAIGTALRRYLDDEIDKGYPQQQTLEETAEEREPGADPNQDVGDVAPETDGGAAATTVVDAPAGESDGTGGSGAAGTTDAQQDLIDAGESPECPDCGSMTLYYSEGCKTCESCGWSEC